MSKLRVLWRSKILYFSSKDFVKLKGRAGEEKIKRNSIFFAKETNEMPGISPSAKINVLNYLYAFDDWLVNHLGYLGASLAGCLSGSVLGCLIFVPLRLLFEKWLLR